MLHAVLGEKSLQTRPMGVGLSPGTSKCPGVLKHPSAGRLEHLSSLTENSDMVMYSLKGIASFEDPFPYLSELVV